MFSCVILYLENVSVSCCLRFLLRGEPSYEDDDDDIIIVFVYFSGGDGGGYDGVWQF